MKHNFSRILFAVAVLSAACAWGQTVGQAGNYSIVEASSLRKRPQDSWARSIAFKDRIASTEPGRAQRLDRRTYLPLELKDAGTAWIREDLYPPFEALPADMEFAFGGTVDQFNRRYYIIVDAAYQIEVLPAQEERWIDALANPPAPAADEPEEDYLAESGDLPVPEADGEETAEPLAEDVSLDGVPEEDVAEMASDAEEAPAENNTVEMAAVGAEVEEAFDFDEVLGADADEVMSDISGIVPDVEEETFEFEEFTGTAEDAEVPVEVAEEAALGDVAAEAENAIAAEIADAAEMLEEAGEETLAEAEEAVEELGVAVDAAESEIPAEEDWFAEEVSGPVEVADTESEDAVIPEMPDDALETETQPLVVEEEVAEEEIWQPEEDFADALPEPMTSVPEVADSYHVAPMDEGAPIALVPLVSLEPTKAELAAQEERRREAERQEAIRQKEAARQAKIEAKRQREEEARRAKAEAAALKKAEAEERAALERERKEAEAARRAEEKRLREEEAQAIAAMEAREAQEREAFAQAAAREALQKERDELAAQVEAERAALAERSRMAQEVIAAEVAAREEAERAAREDAERQAALRAEKEQLEADLAAVAEQQAEVEAQLAAEQSAREEAERLAREEAERAEELAAQERAAAEQLAAARAAAEEQAAAERAAKKAAKKAAKRAARERAAAEEADSDAILAAETDILAEDVVAEEEPVVVPEPAPAPKGRDDIPDWMKPVVF